MHDPSAAESTEPAQQAAAGRGDGPPALSLRWGLLVLFRTAAGGLLVLVSLLAGYLLLAPSPIEPLAYQPPAAPALVGVWQPNERLRDVEWLAVGQVDGPEDVAVDSEGRVYGGSVDGRIVRVLPDGRVETFAETGGRPLGLAFAPNGDLIVADGVRGLLAVDRGGQVRLLTDSADGVRFGFTDDVDVARDGRCYFSDASSRFGPDDYMLDMLEGRPYGRLLRYDPRTNETEVLLEGLYFANGVALSPDEDFVLVNETYRYSITRYWLTGPSARTREMFCENLPGFPDGVSCDGQGRFWVALFTTRNPVAEWLAPRPEWKAIMAKLPRALWPQPAPYGLVVALDTNGRPLESLHDPGGTRYSPITSVEEHDGTLYLGSLTADRIGRYPLP